MICSKRAHNQLYSHFLSIYGVFVYILDPRDKPPLSPSLRPLTMSVVPSLLPYGFRPTPASIPPEHCSFRMKQPSGLPVHIHPLVRASAFHACGFSDTRLLRILWHSCFGVRRFTPTNSPLPIPTSRNPSTIPIPYGAFHLWTHGGRTGAFNRAQRIQNLAYALIWAGIKPGDRVAVIAPNTYVFRTLRSMTLIILHCVVL